MKNVLTVSAIVILVVAIVGGWILVNWEQDARFVRIDVPKPSPSGKFIASIVPGAPQNGVETRIVVIKDSAGTEVFRDGYAYSTRHGLGVTWLSTQDQLWVISSDVGTSYIEQGADGKWSKITPTSDGMSKIPEEIKLLMHH